MSLGGRIAKWGRAALVASLASTPREPQFFLYPQWMRHSSTTPPQPIPVHNGRPSTVFTRNYTTPTIKSPHIATDTRKDTQETNFIENDRDIPSDQTDDQSRGAGNEAEKDLSAALRVDTSLAKHQKPSSVVRFYAAQSLAFGNRIDQILRIQKRNEKNKHSKRTVRRLYQENKREETQSWIPDWRLILSELRERTPRHHEWFDMAVSITIPESANGSLLRGVDENMWSIAEKYDCSVTLANRDGITKQYDVFILSGSALAISKTAAEAMRIAPGSKLAQGPKANRSADSDSSTPRPTIDRDNGLSPGPAFRFVKSELHDTISAIRADVIPRPSEWTTRTFADYVNTLTSLQMPNHMHHLLYKKSESHVKTVIKILREIFTDVECKSSLSRTAFNKALDYFVKTSSIADARATFVLMDIMGIKMSPETFNIMLRGAAKNDDLHNFHYILHLMLRRGISPNGNTWIAFLMCNHDSRIKPLIVAEMKAKGLLAHPAVTRRVCQELLLLEVNASLDAGQSRDEFLNHMDSRYGKVWLTVDNGNRVLHALGARNLISRCWEFLQTMNARFAKIDHVSIDTILNHCKQQTNVVGAIEIMRLLPTLIPYQPGQSTYHTLFELAWRTRSYNLARVVWKYACLNAGTTRRMRMLVFQSLINAVENPGPPEASQPRIWRQQAGLVITNGVFDYPTLEYPSDNEHSGLELDHTRTKEVVPAAPLSWKQVYQAVNKQLKREYEAFRSYSPSRPFADMLMEAWEQDRNWQSSRMRSKGGEKIDWKLKEVIDVPVKSRR